MPDERSATRKQVAHSLLARGYERVSKESEADVRASEYMQACAIWLIRKRWGKMGMLGRLAKERPHVVFGFLGCMAQARGGRIG